MWKFLVDHFIEIYYICICLAPTSDYFSDASSLRHVHVSSPTSNPLSLSYHNFPVEVKQRKTSSLGKHSTSTSGASKQTVEVSIYTYACMYV